MYIRHTPRYTGFGLGAEQDVFVLPPSAAPSNFSQPVTILGRRFNWTEIFAGLGVFFVAAYFYSTGKSVKRRVSSSLAERKSRQIRRKKLEAELATL